VAHHSGMRRLPEALIRTDAVRPGVDCPYRVRWQWGTVKRCGWPRRKLRVRP
jgi:hypothetical protein